MSSTPDLLKTFLLENGINNASLTTMLREFLENGGTGGSVSWEDITGKPTFSDVATSGQYSDLSGTPALGSAASADTGDFATAAQGSLAASAVQPGDLASVATTGSSDDVSVIALTSSEGNISIPAGTVTQALQSLLDLLDPAVEEA